MDKKTIIYGLVGVAAIAGIVWYAGQNEQVANQMASLVGADTETQLKKTGEQISELPLADLFVGSPDAPVVMIEYSSHFCGHCVTFHKETLPLIMDDYVRTGKLKIIQRVLGPREMGKAVFCAEEQGAFSQYNEYVFEHVAEIQSLEDIEIMAGKAGLNQDEFSECFESDKYADKVENWYAQAQEAGVTGTPSFLIGGELIVGNQPLLIFQQAIEKELQKAEQESEESERD